MARFLILLFPYLIIFSLSLYQPIDADLGWHLKYGEYFFQHGQILRDNSFSTEMPDFKWANTSWGTDLLSFAIYNVFGFWGLSILSAAVVTLSFYFVSMTAKLDFFEKSVIFPFLIFLLEPVNLVSFRGQLISLLFLTILFFILTKFEETKTKLIYLLIPLFAIWINIHGEFILGLGLFYAWLLVYLFKLFITEREVINFRGLRVHGFLKFVFSLASFQHLRTNSAAEDCNTYFAYIPGLKVQGFGEGVIKNYGALKVIGVVAILSALGTLLNPFGIEIYKILIAHFQNPALKDIIEYLPLDKFSPLWWNHLTLSLFLAVSLAITFFSEGLKNRLSIIFPIGILLVLSFSVRRYSWALYYLAVPLLKPIASLFKPREETNAKFLGSFVLIVYFIVMVLINNPFTRAENMTWDSYCQKVSCSPKAAEYLVANGHQGNLLTLYNWGGWLIWNYPEIKPSIDGRMHLWKDSSGYSAFSEYYPLEQNLEDINKSKYDTVFISPEKPVFRRLQELVDEGKWETVYQDGQASIFTRK